MQALESLNDTQVNDFLSGKTPLNLSMRLGDHMMLIQLQLSTVNSANAPSTSSSATSEPTTSDYASRLASRSLSAVGHDLRASNRARNASSRASFIQTASSSAGEPGIAGTSQGHRTKIQPLATNIDEVQQKDLMLSNEDFESLKNIVSSLSNMHEDEKQGQNADHIELKEEFNDIQLDQSPIKSLSNLVSNPIKTIPIKNIPTASTSRSSDSHFPEKSLGCPDPISAKLTSCLCKRFDGNSSSNSCNSECQYSRMQQPLPMQTKIKSARTSSALLRRTLNNPITRTRSHGFQPLGQRQLHSAFGNNPDGDILRSRSSESLYSTDGVDGSLDSESELFAGQTMQEIDSAACEPMIEGRSSDNLAEASRNLAKTLRNLSKEVFTNKMSTTTSSDEPSVRSRNGNASSSLAPTSTGGKTASAGKIVSTNGIGSGAVIESMRNHGRGIYSGTFSGTLNPALQDRFGRPKRDISTVIHILNDLLSATPHYSRGARISFEPTQSARSGSKYVS